MKTLIIEGGKPLYGTVCVSGSKNAALPVIFASLITHGVSEIVNLPDISDVGTALEIIKGFGARISRAGNTTYIDTTSLTFIKPRDELVSRLRASTYLLGACLVRFGEAYIQNFGGCNFSVRPIDMHLGSAEMFGAQLTGNRLVAPHLSPADIVFKKCSVGATVNTLIMAAGTEGKSSIAYRSREPHIDTLIEYLSSAGAIISEQGDFLFANGGRLGGGRVYIPGDMIEAGTYLSLAAVTGGAIRVLGVNPFELLPFLKVIRDAGVSAEVIESSVTVKGRPKEPISVKTAPYPGFPTDLQPVLAPLMATGAGGSIQDTVWEGRFGYLSELQKLGLCYSLRGNTAEIFPSELHSGDIRATDLRGGAASVITALASSGLCRIENAELIDRGYERMVEKLTALGAEIKYNN